MIEAAIQAYPQIAGSGADATARLAAMCETIQRLCPTAQAAPPTGKERERLQDLEETAGHVLLLPRRRDRLTGRRADLSPGAARPGRPPPGDTAPATNTPDDDEAPRFEAAARLRDETGAALWQLADHAAKETRDGIEKALLHWDQAGNLELLSPAGRQAALALHGRASAALREIRTAQRRSAGLLALLAAAAEAMLAIDAACTLLRAVEVRFVALLRERLRQQSGGLPLSNSAEREALLPGGAPFLDLGGALLLVAQAYGHPRTEGAAEAAPPASAAPQPATGGEAAPQPATAPPVPATSGSKATAQPAAAPGTPTPVEPPMAAEPTPRNPPSVPEIAPPAEPPMAAEPTPRNPPSVPEIAPPRGAIDGR